PVVVGTQTGVVTARVPEVGGPVGHIDPVVADAAYIFSHPLRADDAQWAAHVSSSRCGQRLQQSLAVPDVELPAVVDLSGVTGEVAVDRFLGRHPLASVEHARASENSVGDAVGHPLVGAFFAGF